MMERVHTVYGMRSSVISAFIVFQIAVLLSGLVILGGDGTGFGA